MDWTAKPKRTVISGAKFIWWSSSKCCPSGISTGAVQPLSELMVWMVGHNTFSANLFIVPNWEK